MLGLYLHVPFCSSICSYCNFNRGLRDPDLEPRYVAALGREIRERSDGRDVDTIFFGGGTPSLLDPVDLRRILDACRESYRVAPSAEITLETNPETATPGRLASFRDAGVNRISFGVQSFDDEELQRLGRIHSAERARVAVRDARAAGFDNLSFDLMFWLPGQSLDSWRRTIADAIALAPDHLSLYLLELYPNAPLKEAMARASQGSGAESHASSAQCPTPSADVSSAQCQVPSAWSQAPDDDAADMYLAALEALDAAGLVQYEISNVARPGFPSRHNVKYWQGGDWRGFGCGAHSTVDGVRWKNVASTTDYIAAVTEGRDAGLDRQVLSPHERVEEALFTGLRLTSGVATRNFLARYGVDPWVRYGSALAPCVGDGLMWRNDDGFGLTRRGMLVANEILTTFV
jgi:oxygen-independent coproporphyrinogen III oxidase